MLFFALQRAIFLIYYTQTIKISKIPLGNVLQTFIAAIKLDAATTSYILIIPCILLVIRGFTVKKWVTTANNMYTLLVLLIYLLISSGELGLFGEWQTKLNYKAIAYLKNPTEVYNSISTARFFFLIGLVIAQLIVFYFLYKKYINRNDKSAYSDKVLSKIIFIVFVPILLFIGMRGGINQIPISASESYFSRYNILNIAAVNNAYYLTFNLIEYSHFEETNQFEFMPDDEALMIVKKLHQVEKDTTTMILKSNRPNIIVIFLESWSGDLIESLGGQPGLTPEFHELEKEGFLFKNFYTTGNRSQQAIAAVFAGLPAIPISTLTDYPHKYKALPSLVKDLKAEGYYSSFVFGGDLNYGNIKSYLIYNQFDNLVEEDDFGSTAVRGKLGVHDEDLFDRVLAEVDDQPEPFFTVALTLSSHSPYDQPGERPIDWIEFENEYVNSAWYTDRCLGNFFRKAKEKPWFENTLFIVLSDHSHMSYNNYQLWSFQYRHIPLLFLGGALSDDFRGQQHDRVASNSDITSTILKQLELNTDEYFWSKNMFNPYAPQFAFFETNNGFGWKNSEYFLESHVVESFDWNKNVPNDKLDAFRKEGQAYLQTLLKEFIEY